jgi:DNA-binding IclR family transcriptional regulator
MSTRGRSPRNRSLERGIAILRAFRPGTELLGNGELAERTGLPRATISRLTATLAEAGWLDHCAAQRAYRLGAPVLTLAHAMRSSSPLLRVATPAMTALARRLRINVGLAVRDGDEMVYLESVRCNAKGAQRSVVSGQRVPIELTALGRAWLAGAPARERAAVLAQVRARRRRRWRVLAGQIADAAACVARDGYCVAAWQPQVVALATPLLSARAPIHVLNVSVTTEEPAPAVAAALAQPLMTLAARLRQVIDGADP